MDTFTLFCSIIYVFGIVMWLVIWKFLVGYNNFMQRKLLLIPFAGAIMAFVVNIILLNVAPTTANDYDHALKIYSFVEENAKTLAQLSLAIALFVVITFGESNKILKIEASLKKHFIYLVLWAFLFAVLGCLPLYWIPPIGSWLDVLRHIKTVPYIYSLFLLATGITIFIYDLHCQLINGNAKECNIK